MMFAHEEDWQRTGEKIQFAGDQLSGRSLVLTRSRPQTHCTGVYECVEQQEYGTVYICLSQHQL